VTPSPVAPGVTHPSDATGPILPEFCGKLTTGPPVSTVVHSASAVSGANPWGHADSRQLSGILSKRKSARKFVRKLSVAKL